MKKIIFSIAGLIIIALIVIPIYLLPKKAVSKKPEAYHKEKIDDKYKSFIDKERLELNDYTKNKPKYKVIFKSIIKGKTYTMCVNSNADKLTLIYEDNIYNYIINIKNVNAQRNTENIVSKMLIDNTEFRDVYLLCNSSGNYFISIPLKNVIFPLQSYISNKDGDSVKYENVEFIMTDAKNTLDMGKMFSQAIIDTSDKFKVVYKDGIISRNGEMFSKEYHTLTWVFYRGKKVILERDADKEMGMNIQDCKDIFITKGEYSCYLALFIDGRYQKVSNIISWTNK